MDQYEKNILEFNRQLNFGGLEIKNFDLLKKYPKSDSVIIVGMGGSGLPGLLFKGLSQNLGFKKPIIIWKNYDLPVHGFKRPLYIFISFSGTTEETLSGFKKLIKRKPKANMAVLATGGSLKDLAERFKLPLVSFSAPGLTPRESLGKMYYGLQKILLIKEPILKTPEFSSKINPKSLKKFGQILAKKIRNRIPLIYTEAKYGYLGYIWKTNFNETAKHPAFTNVLPETVHNEIAMLENKKFPFFVLFLTDSKAPQNILKKTKATAKVLRNNRIPFTFLPLKGKKEEEKAWRSIILSHLTSFYLAKLNRKNPTQTRFISELKELIK